MHCLVPNGGADSLGTKKKWLMLLTNIANMAVAELQVAKAKFVFEWLNYRELQIQGQHRLLSEHSTVL